MDAGPSEVDPAKARASMAQPRQCALSAYLTIFFPDVNGARSSANVAARARSDMKRPSVFVSNMPQRPQSAASTATGSKVSVSLPGEKVPKKAPPARKKGKEPVGNFVLTVSYLGDSFDSLQQ